jgi:hypothetical protein
MHHLGLFARVGLLALILGTIGSLAGTLLADYRSLRQARADEVRSRVVGYEGITPAMSYAKHPKDWFRREGSVCWLWSGWDPKAGHGWFRVEPDALDPTRLSGFFGKDTIRALDEGIFESAGESRWSLIPDEARVFSLDAFGSDVAYPFTVLEKVGIINAKVGGRPLLVVFSPWAPAESAAPVYEARLPSGELLSMGVTGYFLDGQLVLYDRKDEGLWLPGPDGLKSLTGRHRGLSLPRATTLELVSWSRWKSAHPKGRVLVGAERPRAGASRLNDLARKD